MPMDAAGLAALAREIARPERDWVILAEGNVSACVGDDVVLVKSSGSRMADATSDDMVSVSLRQLLALIDDDERGDDDVQRLFDEIASACGRRPSVEALLHAVCLDIPGVGVVGHAHPTVLLGILSSTQSETVVRPLFPDQIVVLGTAPLYVPYIDPGLPLARAVRAMLRDLPVPPRLIYLENHGVFALGATPGDVVQILAMTVKSAAVLSTALAVGGARFLSDVHATRIDTRPDEIHRRRVLAE